MPSILPWLCVICELPLPTLFYPTSWDGPSPDCQLCCSLCASNGWEVLSLSLYLHPVRFIVHAQPVLLPGTLDRCLGSLRPLTGNCFSRQMLKVLVWLGFSFFRGTRVSPMNSL